MKGRAEEWAQITEAFGTTHLSQDSNELILKHTSEQEKKGHGSHRGSHNDGKQASPNAIPSQPSSNSTNPALWLGNVVKTGFDSAYLKERARLSDAAYWEIGISCCLHWTQGDTAMASHGAIVII